VERGTHSTQRLTPEAHIQAETAAQTAGAAEWPVKVGRIEAAQSVEMEQSLLAVG